MTKIIVTHLNPDQDALTGLWLIKRFLAGWEEAEVKFVPAGETLNSKPPDNDPDVIHLDTGLGRFDHHGRRGFTSAANLCLGEILTKASLSEPERETLVRLVAVVTEVDNGRDVSWPEADADRYEFMLHSFFESSFVAEDLLSFGMVALDKIFQAMKKKVEAEKSLKDKGVVFGTKWGKAVAVETTNDQVLQVGQKQGFALVIKKNPKTGFLRIYGRWDRKIDLSGVCAELKKQDPDATWYLHPSGCLLLNGSISNPKMRPTRMSLAEIIKVISTPGVEIASRPGIYDIRSLIKCLIWLSFLW